MTKARNAPEWLRDIRGYPAYLLCVHTRLNRWWPSLWFALLPYAGDWIYREDRRKLGRMERDHA